MELTNKSLGQHWLRDEASLAAVAEAAEVGLSDTVLEIGPGLGTLTLVLTQRARRVVAVEFDAALADDLSARVMADNLEVVRLDALRFDLSTLPADYKVAANIPYYLTAKLIRMLLEADNPPLLSALLVQKEVAQRLAARPGELSVLGVSAQFYTEVTLMQEVPAHLFTPPPKVDSQIVQLRRRPQRLFPDIEPSDFFRVVKAGFSEKRKKLRSSLSGGLHISKQAADALLATVGIAGEARAQELQLDDWYRLARYIVDHPSTPVRSSDSPR